MQCDAYDYETGDFGEITQRAGGRYDTYDYGTGAFRETTPQLEGNLHLSYRLTDIFCISS